MGDVKKDNDDSGQNTYRPVSQAFNMLPGLANCNNNSFVAARNTEFSKGDRDMVGNRDVYGSDGGSSFMMRQSVGLESDAASSVMIRR